MTYEHTRKTYDHGIVGRIVQDEGVTNPWTDWDCQPPMVVRSGQSIGGCFTEYDLDDKCPSLDEATVRKHWPSMLSMLGYAPDWPGLMRFARDEYDTHGYPLWDVLADAVADHIASSYASDRLDMLHSVYTLWLGYPAINVDVRGSCQGDWAELLIVATPEYCESIGATPTVESLRADAETYEQWAYGDVWQVTVEDADGAVADSLCGIYGYASALREMDAMAASAIERAEREQAEAAYWAERDVMTEGV